MKEEIHDNSCVLDKSEIGTFGITARTSARKLLSGTVNYAEYMLFTSDESPIVEQVVVTSDGSSIEKVKWTDESLPAAHEVWRIFTGVQKGQETEAEDVLESFRGLIAAFEAKDIDQLMSFYDPDYRDINGYGIEYVRRAWSWWYQRTVIPYAVAQVRKWDKSQVGNGLISFTAWNLFRGTVVWDEPFGYHGRVRIPRHEGQRVTWTWKQNGPGQWKLIGTGPALPNFGEMLWNSRGHDVQHTMKDFSDTPASSGTK